MFWGDCLQFWNPSRWIQTRGIRSTIRDRYFNSASTAPASVFPILNRLKNSHLKKLEREKGSSKIYYERLLTELMGEAGAFSTASVPGGAGRIRIGILSSDAETV